MIVTVSSAQIEDLVNITLPYDIDLDVSGGKMYWTDYSSNKIQRSDLDGSNVEDLLSLGSTHYPNGIALDVAGGKMYWTGKGTNDIYRADLDGTNSETLVFDVNSPRQIALDIPGGKMYWASFGSNKIQRADLDGSNVEDIITGGYSYYGIALQFQAAPVPELPTGFIPILGILVPVVIRIKKKRGK